MSGSEEVKKSGSGLAVGGIVLAIIALLATGVVAYWAYGARGELKKATSGIDEIKKSLDDYKTEVANLNARLDKTDGAIGSFNSQLAETKGEISKVNSQCANTNNMFGDFKTQLEGLKGDVGAGKAESQASREMINDVQNKLEQLKGDVKGAVNKYEEINDKIAKLTEQIVLAETSMNELYGELESIKSAQNKEEEPTADDYFAKAEKFYSDRDWDSAIKFYNRAIKLKGNWAVAYNNRGMAKFYNEDYEGAIEDLNQARKLDPTRADAVGKYIEKSKEKLAEEEK